MVPNYSQNSFWKSPSTWLVTLIRLAAIIISHTSSVKTSIPGSWLYSPSLTSLVIKPSLTLSHVREALAIQRLVSGKFSDAYAAHPRIQLPPLLLASLTPLVQSKYAELYFALLCLLLDFLLAAMIEAIARFALFTNRVESVDQEAKEQAQLPEAIQPQNSHIFAIYEEESYKEAKESPLIPMESLPLVAAQLYFWSPITFLSGSVYSCFQAFPGFFLVASLFEGVRCGGSSLLSTFFLAVAAYLELHHVVFLLPLAALPLGKGKSRPLWMVLSFGFWFACLQGLSYQLVGPKMLEKVIQATYGLGWSTIQPNLSVQWYFAMQLFSRFRDYFGAMCVGLPYMLVVPITMRLYKYPMELVAAFSMIFTIFRPVETLFDANLSFCFLLLCPRSLSRMGTVVFLSLCSMGVPVILNVVDHWMWLGPHTGNANYMFFQCLAYNIFLGIILGQFCKASLERDKALRLAAKEASAT